MAVTGVTKGIAEFIVRSHFADYPKETVEYAKDLALSHLGCVLWGSTLAVAKPVIDLVRQMGGTPEAGVMGAGFRAPLLNAVLANGTSDHAAELEGISGPECTNPMTVWPVVFTLGEHLRVSGQKLLEAFVIGIEVQNRIGRGCMRVIPKGIFALSHFGVFGAAAATAKLLNLSVEKTRVALSIAASCASGMGRQPSTMMHYLESGLACKHGVMAGLLAKDGFTADMDMLDDIPGRYNGYCTAYADTVDINAILDGLGKPPYRVEQIDNKRYPCCNVQQRFIYGTSELVKAKNIAAEDVEEVIVEGNPLVKVLLNRPDPKDSEDARFSIYHGVSAAIIDRDVNKQSFLKTQDPRFIEMRRKVKVRIDADVNAEFKAGADRVTIKLKDGTEHRGEFTTYRGEKSCRFSREEATAKYREYAGELLTDDELDKVREVVLELEKCSDLMPFMHILTFPGKLSRVSS